MNDVPTPAKIIHRRGGRRQAAEQPEDGRAGASAGGPDVMRPSGGCAQAWPRPRSTPEPRTDTLSLPSLLTTRWSMVSLPVIWVSAWGAEMGASTAVQFRIVPAVLRSTDCRGRT